MAKNIHWYIKPENKFTRDALNAELNTKHIESESIQTTEGEWITVWEITEFSHVEHIPKLAKELWKSRLSEPNIKFRLFKVSGINGRAADITRLL